MKLFRYSGTIVRLVNNSNGRTKQLIDYQHTPTQIKETFFKVGNTEFYINGENSFRYYDEQKDGISEGKKGWKNIDISTDKGKETFRSLLSQDVTVKIKNKVSITKFGWTLFICLVALIVYLIYLLANKK